MNKIVNLAMLALTLSACAAPQTPAPTITPEANLPNPASVHCREMGNTLDIRTEADGSQHGVCVLPDGTECDEWAYFRDECGPATSPVEATQTPGSAEDVNDWWGVIKKTEAGAQFDDYFERQDLGQPIDFGLDSRDPAVEAQIESLRDTGTVVHLYGTLSSDVPDVNGSQILVVKLVVGE